MVYCRSVIQGAIWRALLVLVFCFGFSGLHAQKFHFGGSAAVLTSQVDGDNLRGFNKFGFSVGLLSGYALNENSDLVVQLQYATFGSAQSKEFGEPYLETEIHTLSFLAGYNLRFGDSWDGEKKFRILIGPRLHAIQKSRLGRNRVSGGLDRYFVSANLTFGAILSDAFVLDVSYNHGLSNILKSPMETIHNLRPYYLSLGITYYLYK